MTLLWSFALECWHSGGMMPELFQSICESVQERYSRKSVLPMAQVQNLAAAAFGYSSFSAFKASGGNDVSLLALTFDENPSYFIDRPSSKFKQFCLDEERLEKRSIELQGLGESPLDPSFFSTCLTDSLYEFQGIAESCEVSDDESEFIKRLSVLADSGLRDDAKLFSRYREITITPLNRVIRLNPIKDAFSDYSATFEVIWCEKSGISWPGPFADDFTRDECTIFMKRVKPRIFFLDQMNFPKFLAISKA